MIPADNESTSANESEEDTSAQKTFREKKMRWKVHKKNSNEPARLKTLPKYLMHWLTPVWIALAGFLIALAFAANWRGTFHWPSADAMRLCATIAGAGFAFSAWQQRSHDNAVRDNDKLEQEQAATRARAEREEQRSLEETRRLEQIERDEYWKRREHIFQLLNSKKPALRLSAIELLAELADIADKSNLLNDAAKLQLQRHIINILCHQLRHEGLEDANDGNNLEHANIQDLILRTIFTRINRHSDYKYCANWNTAQIKIEDTNILTPIALTDITTEATLDVNSTTFYETVCIKNAKLHSLIWEQATFLSTLSVGSDSHYPPEQPSVILGTYNIPTRVRGATFNSVTFITENPFFTIQINEPTSTDGHIPKINLKQCNFINKRCHCSSNCQCRKQNIENQCLCLIRNKCTCNRMCINSQVSFVEASTDHTAADLQVFFSLQNSQIGRLFLTNTARTPFIKLQGNYITDQIFIFSSDTRRQEPWTKVDIHDNTIFFGGLFTKPIEIAAKSLSSLLGAIDIGRNFIVDPDNSKKRQEFSHLPTYIDTTEITFTASTPTDFPPLISSWTTGKED